LSFGRADGGPGSWIVAGVIAGAAGLSHRRHRPGRSRAGTGPGLLEKGGLTVTADGEVPASLCYADHEQAWTAHTSAGPLQKVIEIAGAEAVRRALHDVLEADRKPDGQLRQDNVFRYVIATS
jgi:hypothetical protein